jgi:tRNA threonylcarbamoyladenosine biosynthesis protein TsaB
MRLLAFETTDMTGTLALAEGERLLVDRALVAGQRSAQALAPAIDEALKELRWKPDEIELIAVATGPGSFTGLRVGVTMAKTLAYTSGAAVLGVNSLEVTHARAAAWLAQQTGAPWNAVREIVSVIDAQRQQAMVTRRPRELGADESPSLFDDETRLVDIDALVASLDETTLVTGPLLARFATRLAPQVPQTPESVWRPSAGALAQVAWRKYQAGLRGDVWTLAPRYFRLSAAEEKWAARG